MTVKLIVIVFIYLFVCAPTWREARDKDRSNTLHTGSINLQNKINKDKSRSNNITQTSLDLRYLL